MPLHREDRQRLVLESLDNAPGPGPGEGRRPQASAELRNGLVMVAIHRRPRPEDAGRERSAEEVHVVDPPA